MVCMKENLVFVFNNEDFKDLNQLRDLGKNVLIICKDYEIKEKYSKMKIDCKMITEYDLSDIQITKSSEWMKSWPNKILQNDKNFKELFMYNDISIFWYLQSRLYHKRIHELITLIEQIKKILSVEKPNKILVIGDSEYYHILSYLHDNVKYIEKPNKIVRSKISDNSYSGFLIWKLFLLKITRGTIIPIQKLNKTNSILFLTEVSSWRKTYNYFSKKYEYQDVFFHNIIKELNGKEQQVEVIDFENKPSRLLSSFSLNKKRTQSFGTTVIPWEKFLTLKIILKSKSVHNEFKKTWKNLKKSDEFKKSLNFEGIPIYELVKDDFNELFNSFKSLAAIAMIETAKRIVETKRPSEIVMHDEYGALQLSFLYASKKFKISTLSLQHGAIFQNIFAYSHRDEDINNDKNELNFPLPDKMCVWSESARKALITSAKFLSSSLIVTGDPQMDFLNDIKKEFNRKKILEKFKIPSEKKIILFATENLTSLEERDLVSDTVFESMSNLTDYFLIIKIHPNETDFLIYQKIAEKFNISSYVILKDVSLYELFHVCDLVIVSFSTVGLEAMRVLKPVISLNLMGIHNEAIIIKNNFVIEVRMKNELIPAIMKCFENQNNENIQSSKIFAEQELGKIGRNATKMIVQNILDLKNSKKEGFEE